MNGAKTGLGGRAARTARLTRLSATAGAGLLAARRSSARGDTEATAALHADVAEALFETLGSMKGAAMKVGQVLSYIDLDVDPATSALYQQRLAALCDTAPPTDTPAVEGVIAEQFGAPVDQVFAEWDPTPVAVASIGQVHRARLDSGDDVAVKVQHPGVAEALTADLANLGAFAGLVRLAQPNLDVRPMLGEVRERVLAELDYQQEALYQQAFADRFAGHPFIRVPGVHHDYCRPRVLVSDFVEGASFEEAAASASPTERDRYGEILFRFCFGSLYRFRLFNADPHPGNFLFPGDGTVACIDYGCCKAFSSASARRLHAVHRAVAAEDELALAAALRTAGLLPEHADPDMGVVLRWFRQAREPMRDDAPYTYTSDYARRVNSASLDPAAGYQPTLRQLTMPPDYLLLTRIQYGLNSLLGRLQPTANWHRIMDELAEGAAPTTPLGEVEQAFFSTAA